MTQAIAKREPRALGLAAQPTLRLRLGRKGGKGEPAVVKFDGFDPSPNEEYRAAAEKFREVYGDKPKEIDIMLPTSLGQALDVRYRGFYGTKNAAGDIEGGGMSAVGEINFAMLGVLGGPDTLMVWNPDGTVEHVDITGPDDPKCAELGVQLYTTFRFSIPSVLGAGGICEITSKGKKTTDNLFERLITLYGWFGVKTPFVVRPTLVLRKASAQTVVKDRQTGKPKRIKSSFFALDIRVRETLDDMIGRMEQQAALLPGGSATAALYGKQRPDRPAIEAVARSLTSASESAGVPSASDEELEPGTVEGDVDEVEEAGGESVRASAGPASSAPTEEPPLEGEVVEERSKFDPPKSARAKAARIKELGATPVMGHESKTLADVKPDGEWFEWALQGGSPQWSPEFRAIFEEYVQLAYPDKWEEYKTNTDGQMELG